MTSFADKAAAMQKAWREKGRWYRHRELPKLIRLINLHGGEHAAAITLSRSLAPCSLSRPM